MLIGLNDYVGALNVHFSRSFYLCFSHVTRRQFILYRYGITAKSSVLAPRANVVDHFALRKEIASLVQ